MDEYEARNVVMMAYLAKVKEHSKSFTTFEIKHVPRSENRQADALLKLASSSPYGHPKSIHWEILHQPTMVPEVVAWVDKITSKEEDVGTSLACADKRMNVPEGAPLPAAWHAPSLVYPGGHHLNASSTLL